MILILLGVAGAVAIGILMVLLLPASLVTPFTNLSTRLSAAPGDRRLQELQLEMTVLGLIIFVPSVILLLLELRRPTRDSIRISNVSGSEAHLSTQAVAQSLIYYIDALQGVVRVKPRLVANKNAVNVRLDVETLPDIDVRAKTAEITQTARNVVEERLGLKLNRLNIHIHHVAYPRAGAPYPLKPELARPTPPVSAANPPMPVENKNPLSS